MHVSTPARDVHKCIPADTQCLCKQPLQVPLLAPQHKATTTTLPNSKPAAEVQGLRSQASSIMTTLRARACYS